MIDKFIGIIYNTTNKDRIIEIKKEHKILSIENINKKAWVILAHDIIYNSKNMPEYYKKLIEIKKNRNGLVIKTIFRKSNFGNNISYNIMEKHWNKLNIDDRNIQDKVLYNYKIHEILISSQN